MRHTFLFTILINAFFSFNSGVVVAQNAIPHWAKRINSPSTQTGVFVDIATDKHGNVYGLMQEAGTVNVDGQITSDTNTRLVLASWNCDGTFRWMKAIGSATGSIQGHLEVDTSEGVYLFGSLTSGTFTWANDTSITIPQSVKGAYLMKYNSLGQLQWFQTPVTSFANNIFYDLSVSQSGEIYCLALLEPGSYNGGLSIPTKKYYAVQYSSSGTYQAAIPLAITQPSTTISIAPKFKYDALMGRFYVVINYTKLMGSVSIGGVPITQQASIMTGSKAVLAAFNKQGNYLWLRQATPDTTSSIAVPAVGPDGRIYLGLWSMPGVIFCWDTLKNTLGNARIAQLMALDTNGNVLWKSRSSSKISSPVISSVGIANNVVVGVGPFVDTMYWGNTQVVNPTGGLRTFVTRVSATTGATIGIDQVATSGSSQPNQTCIDRNSNIYVGGIFDGTLTFATNSFSTPTNSFDLFLAKYRNTQCNCNLLQPSFSFANTGVGAYQFTYTGQVPYASISWDFGDGTPASTASAPSHTYAQPGLYPLCVTVTNGCGNNTDCQFLLYGGTDVQDLSGSWNLRIYPNPVANELNIDGLNGPSTVEIIDVLGRQVVIKTTKGEAERIDVEKLCPGTYIVRVRCKNGDVGSKMFVKQ